MNLQLSFSYFIKFSSNLYIHSSFIPSWLFLASTAYRLLCRVRISEAGWGELPGLPCGPRTIAVSRRAYLQEARQSS